MYPHSCPSTHRNWLNSVKMRRIARQGVNLFIKSHSTSNVPGMADSLVLGTFTLDGVTIAGELATATQSSSAGGDLLDNSVLSVINHTGATRSVEIVVSETGFAGPVDSYEAAV